jgi:DNA-binding NtrC family response regulator
MKILVVDDEAEIRAVLTRALQLEGYDVLIAADGAAALEQLRSEHPSVILLDLAMPKLSGMETLPRIKQMVPDIPVIICTGQTDLPTAIQAMRLGAYDYLTKPLDMDILILTVKRAVERQELRARIEQLEGQRDAISLTERMGSSREIQRVVQQVAQVAGSAFTVLVRGETGTGKELVARAIHQQSARRGQPFVAVDCGAIPDTLVESELLGYERGAFTGAHRRKQGQFQLAHGGTLFLDEIGNVPLVVQPKLLRVLEERQVYPLGGTRPAAVDVRIVAASSLDFEEEIRKGQFRADLYYRLNEFTILVPPLRSRREDIPDLASRFLAEASMELGKSVRGISEAAMSLLQGHYWPGNVRELKNAIRKASLLATDLITPEHLPAFGRADARTAPAADVPRVTEDLSLKETAELAMEEAARQAIARALRAAKGNKSQAAKLLRTDYTTLHSKMKRYGISARDFMSP